MAVMWWWAVPTAATLAAWAIVLWRARASVQRDPVVTVQRLRRFRGAMSRTHRADGQWHGEASDAGTRAGRAPLAETYRTRQPRPDAQQADTGQREAAGPLHVEGRALSAQEPGRDVH